MHSIPYYRALRGVFGSLERRRRANEQYKKYQHKKFLPPVNTNSTPTVNEIVTGWPKYQNEKTILVNFRRFKIMATLSAVVQEASIFTPATHRNCVTMLAIYCTTSTGGSRKVEVAMGSLTEPNIGAEAKTCLNSGSIRGMNGRKSGKAKRCYSNC